MWDKNEQITWEDMQHTWNESSHGKDIKIAVSELVVELKNWTSPFEQDAIKRDIEVIKGSISQFEKDAIKKDLLFIKRYTNKFERDLAKSITGIIPRILKKITSIIKRKKK